MSMYTQLLDAAFGQRGPVLARASERSALDQVLRCRDDLERGAPAAADPDLVPTVLAREIGYDLALLELAEVLGIESDPSRFEQPRTERARLEQAFATCGITLGEGRHDRARRSFPLSPPRVQVPVASLGVSSAERSLRRAAKVAAWVRRSIPSLASRLET